MPHTNLNAAEITNVFPRASCVTVKMTALTSQMNTSGNAAIRHAHPTSSGVKMAPVFRKTGGVTGNLTVQMDRTKKDVSWKKIKYYQLIAYSR